MLQICDRWRAAEIIALDIETSPATQQLALVQIGLRGSTYLIDVLAMDALDVLMPILGPDGPLKLIHNARFEKRILGAVGVTVDHIFDTMRASQKRHGKVVGGHSLAATCDRELGRRIDKTQQCSPWLNRPLTTAQLTYAALDAEILLDLYDALIVPLSQPVEGEG